MFLIYQPAAVGWCGEFAFRHHFIDRDLPGASYGQTCLVDVDKDGDLDFITGGKDERKSVYWFEFRAPDDWVRHLIGVNHPSDVGGTAFDVDGDGWLDHVTGGVWYRNTGRPRTDAFERIVFDAELAAVHDLVAVDLDGDSRPEIITMSDKNNLRWYRVAADPRQPWERKDIAAGVHAGVAVGDIDGDGDIDIARSNVWFENGDGKGLKWMEHAVPFGNPNPPYPLATRCRIVDINQDGHDDLVVTENEIRGGNIAWLENRGGKGQDWTVHELPAGDEAPRGAYHSLAVADFDKDGDLDIFTVEMEAIAGARQPRWFIWENVDGSGATFRERVILDKGLGGHEAVVADVDGDGDLDICSKLWRPRRDNANGGHNHADYVENLLVSDRTAESTANGPLPGQIVIDPQHPRWLKRYEGRQVFICGPGDPEDFLYVGKRNADGTRDGDQVDRIEKLAKHGGNCVYIQLVRTHGGDARPDATQNPFVDSDPAKGLDEDVLRQWDDWFARLDRHNILIYLFFYDDSARIWNTGDRVSPEERAFFETIVKRYKHLKNLIWVIGEESEERYSTARVQALAQIIKDADDRGHPIGDHHQSGTTFKAWQEGGALNHFAMQLSATDDEAHAGAIEALRKADGRYQIIYSESTAMRTDVDGMRSHAWAVAMGGLMPMLLRMDIANTPPNALQQCRHLQTFFEATDFWILSPHDELKHGQTKYVLANPGRSYIAYGNSTASALGIKNLAAGSYAVHWLDCQSGETADAAQNISVPGDASFAKPVGFGLECAAWIRPKSVPAIPEQGGKGSEAASAPFPNPHWPVAADLARVETSAERVNAYNEWLAQRCGDSWAEVVIKHGYLSFEGRGSKCHIHQPNDCGSIKKSLQGTVLGVALQQGRLSSLDDNTLSYWKDPFVTKHENDRQITFREFATYRDRWNDPAPPGKLRYNNSGATAAGACFAGLFQEVRGLRPKGIAEIAWREVIYPIGADWNLWYWEQDFTDTLSNPGPRLVLEASVYELAKLGYLWLRRGKWNDATIFSDSYYREAVTDWSPHTGSTANGFVGHYGYWWLVNAGRALLPDTPPDAFYHIGNGHPKRATGLLIIPSLDTVAVLSMERLSDEGNWDVIQNSRALSNDGMRQWSEQVVKLCGK